MSNMSTLAAMKQPFKVAHLEPCNFGSRQVNTLLGTSKQRLHEML